MELESEAKGYFEQGFNCAQAVFAPFARRLGMDMPLAMKIATPFRGGMAHMGQTCGTVCGALMAIGLATGDGAGNDPDQKEACRKLTETFTRQFVELHGDLTCQGLLGLDLDDPEEFQIFEDEDLYATLCPVFVVDATRLAREILEISD
jgi:C_GCAxxG_C_C family probable redox protein